MSEPTPLADLVVGDRFWLAYAKDAVRSAVVAPEQRAAQLRTSIGWFWTVYSTAGVLALAFGDQHPPGPLSALIALPSFLLLVAYWQASEVGSPRFIDFDPRIPEEIARAHSLAAQHKRRALRRAEMWTASSALVVGIALAAGAVQHTSEVSSVAAHIDARNPARLLISAEVPPNVPVLLSASVATGSYEHGAMLTSTLFHSDSKGSISASLNVPAASAYRVSASWRDAKTAAWHTISSELKKP